MLNAFTLNNGHLERLTFEVTDDLASSAIVWIDLYAASEAEVAQVERSFDLRLPSPEHLRDIEASARFYEHDGKLHLRSDYLSGTESHAHSVAVAFVLAGETLISIHDEDLPIFRLLRIRLHAESGPIENSRDVLIDLYGMDVEFSADALEEVYADLGRVSQSVLNETLSDKQARDSLAEIAHAEHVNGRIRRNVMDTQRALSFMVRTKSLSPSQVEEVKQIQQNIESLDGHTAFLFDKINFLMDAVIGFININQNRVVKLFSVVSVALLPPTLIASIYGMNFQFMPELHWQLGYPFALLLMVLTVGAPLLFFWRKGWLR
ncbi:MAG: magnesium/cobalt transporter CorA [Gammaproteobacteria bacterium]|nr:magnesium/cobalt transporter CorA [Gammaproteobacteria bacterium]MBU1447433.1 magnesium/cobalt transporter CorA [Gammaproteobacteria bacterium]MDD5472327.1 magnesium/cobalt transporter CorA [Sideroxydans sp.]